MLRHQIRKSDEKRIENDGAEYTDHDVVAKEHACAAGQAGERLGQGDAEQQRHADDRLTALVISAEPAPSAERGIRRQTHL